MTFQFPPNPNVGDKVTPPNGFEYEWDGEKWVTVGGGGGSGGGIPDAPIDGLLYGRQDAVWEEVPAAGPPFQGVIDGSNAASGEIGEYLTANSSGVTLVNNVTTTIVSLPITPGDWEVVGHVYVNSNTDGVITRLYTRIIGTGGMGWLGQNQISVAGGWDISAIANRAWVFDVGPARFNLTVGFTTGVQMQAILTGNVSAVAMVGARRMR